MKTAEDYIKQFNLYEEVPLSPELKIYFNERIRRAINEARKAAIEECAERAKVIQFSPLMNALYNNSQSLVGSILAQNDCAVDKQSILSLINELK